MKFIKLLMVFPFVGTCFVAKAGSPLTPIVTDSPRATLQSFMDSMNEYRKRLSGPRDPKRYLDDAVRCLNLDSLPQMVRQDRGRQTAILIKEILDRVYVPNYSQVPSDDKTPSWRIPETDMHLELVADGDRKGEFLFSRDLVGSAYDYYDRVKGLAYLKGTTGGAGYQEPWAERNFPEWLKGDFWGYEKWQYLALGLVFLFGLFFKQSFQISIEWLQKWHRLPAGHFSVLILVTLRKPLAWFLTGLFWTLAVFAIQIENPLLAILLFFIKCLLGFTTIWGAYRVSDIVSEFIRRYAARSDTPLGEQLVPILSKSLRVLIVIVSALIALQNLGVNVMSVLAGLGIGGLALALAAQDSASNLFGSIMILSDRPFRVGDWIVTLEVEGEVEEVGFRSTRIRTFYDSVVTIPNSKLANANIDNMGQRQSRRTRTTLGVTYDTSPERLEAFMEGVRNIIKANPLSLKDKITVIFESYGDSSLNVLVNFFLVVPDSKTEQLQKQNIFLEILRLAKELKVEFAFPTRTLHVETFPEKAPVRVVAQESNADLKNRADSFGPGGSAAHPDGQGIYTKL